MLKTIVDILEDNAALLTPAEQKALRLRLTRRGNTQEALDEEMDNLSGAYNQTNAFVISLLVRIEQLENLLKEKEIPLPEGPDYTLARARIATENRRTLYPELLHALRLAGDRIERDEEVREQAIYLIWHNEDNRTLYENTIRPLRRDQRMHFAKLPVRQQARLCELLLHRRDRDGFSQPTLQALFEVEP